MTDSTFVKQQRAGLVSPHNAAAMTDPSAPRERPTYRDFTTAAFLVWFAFAASIACAAQTPVHVLYVQHNSTILTYNIDPATLSPTLVGQPLTVSEYSGPLQFATSPDGHVLYVLSRVQQSPDSILSVYLTDAYGAPQEPRVEHLGPAPISSFTIYPTGDFLYTITSGTNSEGDANNVLRLYTIDIHTGLFNDPPKVLDQSFTSSYCFVRFGGYTGSRDDLVQVSGCNDYRGFTDAFYSFRMVDLTTGHFLNAPEQLFVVGNQDNVAEDQVTVGLHTVVDLHRAFAPFQQSIYIYRPGRSPQSPVIDCTSGMLLSCGEASAYVANPTGQYLALLLSNSIEIVKVELAYNQIATTGNTIPNPSQPYFSPDDSIIYAANYQPNGTSTVQIYGFDPKTGNLTPGGQLSMPATLWNVFPALRQ